MRRRVQRENIYIYGVTTLLKTKSPSLECHIIFPMQGIKLFNTRKYISAKIHINRKKKINS